MKCLLPTRPILSVVSFVLATGVATANEPAFTPPRPDAARPGLGLGGERVWPIDRLGARDAAAPAPIRRAAIDAPGGGSDVDAALDSALAGEKPAPPAPVDAAPPVTTTPAVPPAPPAQPLSDIGRLIPRPNVWEPPSGNTGYEPLPTPRSPSMASNGGVGAVTLGAKRPGAFRLKTPYRIEQVMTYHYGAKTRPGTIGLRHESGTVYGPWRAAGAIGQGNVRDAYWWVQPDIVIPPGRYEVIDSDPASWAWEAQTRGTGIYQVWGTVER